jgi:Iap family predicted aminopeptidase
VTVALKIDELVAEIGRSDELWRDFQALCALGGRLCGTASEGEARALLGDRLAAIADAHGGRLTRQTMPYEGWRARNCRLRLEGPATAEFEVCALLRSPPTPAGGLTAEVIDLGRGGVEDFEARGEDIAGKMVLVRHEYMFSTDHIHRSRKFAWARERGAAAFLIAAMDDQDGPVAGGAGFAAGADIPAAGISAEVARRLASSDAGLPRARLFLDVERAPAETETLILDLPGRGPEWVVLSAHLDGHDLGQSAIDNASGVAAALAAARTLAPRVSAFERGLRVCLFSVEEWGLLASKAYVEGLSAAERQALVLDINLDSVAGSPNLTAMTSGFDALAPFLTAVAGNCGVALEIHRPLVANSDHYNFAVNGIPAFRLVAGFNEPESRVRYVLTPADTEDKVSVDELRAASLLAAAVAARACADPSLTFREDPEGAVS